MKTNLNLYTEAQLTRLELSEITAIHNEFAVANGTKEVRFAGKSIAIIKCLEEQVTYFWNLTGH